jgi:hypothetical protein
MRKTKRKTIGICVYCGEECKITSEHAVMKNLFPKRRPNNLITVPCCERCNKQASKDEEYFKTVVIMRADLAEHPAAARVLPSVIRGLQRPEAVGFRNGFLACIRKVEIRTRSGLYLGDADAIHGDTVRVERVATRIVQSLFYHERGRRLPNEYEATACLVSKYDVIRDEDLINQALQYLGQLRKTDGRLRGMNTAQAGDLVENLG